MGQRVQVKYHRSILDSQKRVKYPSGTILESMDLVPPGQEDRVFILPDAPGVVTKAASLLEFEPLPDEDEVEED